ncbi:MAG: peptide ABC transporter substrate-binding protein [Caldilinea sp. CFX5]|nr:peptide ABC transporter substrate-binding protein [Caldilinea sp. CFX5]
MLFSACTPPGGAVPGAAPQTQDSNAAPAGEDLSQPHPILSDVRARQAIAHCVDRDALISAVYTYVPDDVKASLRMDSFLPKTHWAYGGPYQDYEYSVEKGGALLDEAGWTLPEDSNYRVNANGDTLELTLTTTNSQFRQTWAAVVEQQLAECGILLIRQHTPASWWFGDTTGLARRDFELGAFAWVGQADPGGRTLYACSMIPTPGNNWEGQNGMGWCNETASNAIVLANNTLNREERKAAYNIVQTEFAKDMVSLPLFQRAEAEAWSLNLEGLVVDPTEYGSASAAKWTLADGGDTIVLGFSQEPASMFSLVESAAVQRQIAQMGIGLINTSYNYDYQPLLQEPLSTLENELATNEMVAVKAGDMVYNEAGEPEELAQGVKVLVDGESVEYDGTSELQLPQLVVTYKLKPYTWSDGTAGSVEDFKLARQIECDKESGATSFTICDAIQDVTYSDSELAMTVTYVPGYQYPLYYLFPFTEVYPSHEVLSDGRNLRDVPAAEWATLPEIAEKPLSYGPFMITDWQKGQSLTLEANPHYADGTGVQKIIVLFIPDTNQAVAQLLAGDVDYVEKATLAGGAEVQLVADAHAQGNINFEIIASPTWEHIDMNMFVKQ